MWRSTGTAVCPVASLARGLYPMGRKLCSSRSYTRIFPRLPVLIVYARSVPVNVVDVLNESVSKHLVPVRPLCRTGRQRSLGVSEPVGTSEVLCAAPCIRTVIVMPVPPLDGTKTVVSAPPTPVCLTALHDDG